MAFKSAFSSVTEGVALAASSVALGFGLAGQAHGIVAKVVFLSIPPAALWRSVVRTGATPKWETSERVHATRVPLTLVHSDVPRLSAEVQDLAV